ncbi:hypothetical protein [Gordonia sp. (in: high G+C Gram-positive bacteria)]|uniref:hypothetical protein n=1 Tax=unclassified Gordonia (in: high G+C Gram-positive bacteria) TaxID=2657482 RepID=UPI0026367C87|nr:hypothetical protein [Gordonia sp. (in: high G+C Gram-positive bacteria)]
MTNDNPGMEIHGAWGALLPDDTRAQMAVVGRDGRHVVIYRTGEDDWDTLAVAYDEEAAKRTADLVRKMTGMPEYLRIGGEGILTGLDSEHPGVEWVVPTAVVDDPDPIVRITGPGTDRLWAVPSTDGEVLGLLNPDGDPREIAEFTSAGAADAFIAMVDALFALAGSRGFTEGLGDD